jgi:hypothetical protein
MVQHLRAAEAGDLACLARRQQAPALVHDADTCKERRYARRPEPLQLLSQRLPRANAGGNRHRRSELRS